MLIKNWNLIIKEKVHTALIERSEKKMKTTGNNITKDENPFESLHNLIVFSPSDFSQTLELAWIYGIIIGWDDEECFREFEKQFTHWNKKDSLRLKKLHDNFVRIARENGAECYGLLQSQEE